MGEEEREGGGRERPDRLFRQHVDPDGERAAVENWRPGIEDLEDLPFLGAGLWRQIGPAPLAVIGEQMVMGIGPNSGEVLDIAIDPSGADAPTLYIATNDGGLWKSKDGGRAWTPLTDLLPTASIGAVAVDPGNPRIVYAGSGNLFEGGGNIPKAMGVWRSNDGGVTWAPLDGGPDATALGEGIIRIVCPAPDVVLAACSNGLWMSVDAGAHFGSNPPTFDDLVPLRAGFMSALEVDTAFRVVRRVENATPATPIVVTCTRHGFKNGDRVSVGGVASNKNANGTWTVQEGADDDHFTLVGSSGNGTGAVSGFVIGPNRPSTVAITDVTLAGAANTIVIRAAAHGLITGDIVAVNGVRGITAANGSRGVRVLDDDRFELVGARGAGAYTGGGIVDGPPHAAPLAITAATNVRGGIELTVAGHGLLDDDRVAVRGLPGIAAPANFGDVQRVDDDHLRVSGLRMTGAFGGTGATVEGPAAAWNMVYVVEAGRPHENIALNPTRGLYRLTLTSDGGLAMSDNILAHSGGRTGEYNRVLFAQSMLPRPGTLYAAVQDTRPNTHLVGLFRSNNYGQNWTDVTTALARSLRTDGTGASDYVFTLGVDPQDRRRVYVAMEQLWRSIDGGATWPTVPVETQGGDLHDELGAYGHSPSTSKLHFDHHELVFPPATHWPWMGSSLAPPPTPVYFGTDGGIARSGDGGETFDHLNEGLSTSLLFHVDMGRGAVKNDVTFGGMQDTGTAGRRLIDPDRLWSQGAGGDGWHVAVDSFNPDIAYGFNNGRLIRTTNGGDVWFQATFAARPIVVQVNNANPVEVVTVAHPFITGDAVTVSGVRSGGALVGAVNGRRRITRVSDRVFTLDGVNGTPLPLFDSAPRAQGDRFVRAGTIVGASNALPIEIDLAQPHGLVGGEVVHVQDVQGVTSANNTAANPTWTVARMSDTRLALNGSDGRLDPPYVKDTGRVRSLDSSDTVPVQFATQADPIVVTALQHGFVTGGRVTIHDVRGNTNANVSNTRITVIDSNSFRLNGVGGDAPFAAGPAVSGSSVGRNLPATNRFERQRLSLVPKAGARSDVVFVSIRNDLFRSDDSGVTFRRVHRFDDEISAIASPEADALWVGLAGRELAGRRAARPGAVHFSRDLGEHWLTAAPDNFVSTIGARGAISGIAVDPRDPLHVAVVVSGYSEIHPHRRTRHCFVTTSGGTGQPGTPAWREKGGGFGSPRNLPDLPVLSAVFDVTTLPAELLVACDGGVLRLVDDDWERVGPNLPTVSCQSLTVDNTVAKPIVRLGTYGRSAWELERPAGPRLVVRGALGFGERPQGETCKLPLALHNPGATDLNVLTFTLAAGDFTITSAGPVPFVLIAGNRLPLDVEFTPAALGLRTATFAIVSDDPTQPLIEFQATGIGVTPGQGRLSVRSGNLRFGVVRVGDTVELPITITNSGTGDADITTLDLDPAGSATITIPTPPALPRTLSAGESMTIIVRLTPTANGPVQRELVIRGTGVSGVVSVTITGEGTTTAANLLSSVLHFLGLAEEPDGVLA